jgi:hypothetical protein
MRSRELMVKVTCQLRALISDCARTSVMTTSEPDRAGFRVDGVPSRADGQETRRITGQTR